REDEIFRVEGPGRRRHADALRRRRPSRDRLLEAERRAVFLGETEVCLNGTLRGEPSGLPLEHALPAVRPLEEWIAPAERRRVEHFVFEVVPARALECARDQLPIRRAGVEPACLGEQLLAAGALELAPQGPRTAEKRDVIGMLVVGEPDDPREAARRTKGVPAREAIEAEH